jgi:hypothetical protein
MAFAALLIAVYSVSLAFGGGSICAAMARRFMFELAHHRIFWEFLSTSSPNGSSKTQMRVTPRPPRNRMPWLCKWRQVGVRHLARELSWRRPYSLPATASAGRQTSSLADGK